mmetsp:Transcript_6817/g.16758  ORF Transcript_6817/g.16758 Transcript_6817/m.16758 type:complete len:201 (-) Transcript_6817:43-645(-)
MVGAGTGGQRKVPQVLHHAGLRHWSAAVLRGQLDLQSCSWLPPPGHRYTALVPQPRQLDDSIHAAVRLPGVRLPDVLEVHDGLALTDLPLGRMTQVQGQGRFSADRPELGPLGGAVRDPKPRKFRDRQGHRLLHGPQNGHVGPQVPQRREEPSMVGGIRVQGVEGSLHPQPGRRIVLSKPQPLGSLLQPLLQPLVHHPPL